MKDNIAEAVKYVTEMIWRRRRMLWRPFFIMLLLSTIATLLLPRQYASHALLAMQEQGADNPLIKTQTTSERIRERAPGLKALLKSDRVLVNSLKDILGDRMPTDPRKVALLVKDLDEDLSFEMIGTDFLQFQLKSDKREGLGRKLEIITSRFLESILSPDQDALSATQVLLEKRREEVSNAEKALTRFKEQLGDAALSGIAAANSRTAQGAAGAERNVSDLAATSADIQALAASIGLNGDTRSPQVLDAAINAAGAELADAEKRGPAGAEVVSINRNRLVTLSRIRAQETRRSELERDLAVARSATVALPGAAENRSPEGQLRRLERELVEARQLYDTYQRRFPAATSTRSLQVLNAPERIRVIDAPRDPEFPLASRLKFLLAGLFASMLLSAGLVLSTEAVDQRIRRARDFETIAGVPVIARLPRADRDTDTNRDKRDARPDTPKGPLPDAANDANGGSARTGTRLSAA